LIDDCVVFNFVGQLDISNQEKNQEIYLKQRHNFSLCFNSQRCNIQGVFYWSRPKNQLFKQILKLSTFTSNVVEMVSEFTIRPAKETPGICFTSV